MKSSPIMTLKYGSKKGFNLLATINRDIKSAQTEKIRQSILFQGILRQVIVADLDFITGKKETYIIDGQHLYNACQGLQMDVEYRYTNLKITNHKELVECIAFLNATSKSWCLADYIQAWGSFMEDYKELNRLMGIYNLEANIVAAIMSNKSTQSGSTATNMIKKGLFKIVDKEKNIKMLSMISEVLDVVGSLSRYENRHFVTSYIKFVKDGKYDHKSFLKGLKLNKHQFRLAITNESNLIDLFMTI